MVQAQPGNFDRVDRILKNAHYPDIIEANQKAKYSTPTRFHLRSSLDQFQNRWINFRSPVEFQMFEYCVQFTHLPTSV